MKQRLFSLLAHQQYFIDSRGLCIQLSRWYNEHYDLFDPNKHWGQFAELWNMQGAGRLAAPLDAGSFLKPCCAPGGLRGFWMKGMPSTDGIKGPNHNLSTAVSGETPTAFSMLWTSPAPCIKSQFYVMSSHTTKNVRGLYGVSSIQPMTISKKSLILCLKTKIPTCAGMLLGPELSLWKEKFEKSAQAFIKRVSHVHLHQPRKVGEGGREKRQRNKRMLMKIEW